jgi:outer membrane protein assembly factor BamD
MSIALPAIQTTGRCSRPSLLVLLGCLLVSQTFLAACTLPTGDVRSPGALKKSLEGIDEQVFVEDSADKHFHPNVILKRGEAFFEKEEYTEALVEYNHFLTLHKNHMLAPYVAFRIGEVHFKMAKTIDRDPDPMHKAIAALEKMRTDFPGSRYDAQAQQKLRECHDWLSQMHLFVGQFYYRRGSYLAAAHRFELIMKNYPDMPVAPDALYFLAKTYHDLGADDWAKDNLVLLVEKYPNSTSAENGKSLLAKISGAQPGLLLAKKSDSVTFSDIGPTAGGKAGQNSSESFSPSLPQLGGLRLPSANSLGQAFTVCRLGAWC